jgi:hypothetical protein
MRGVGTMEPDATRSGRRENSDFDDGAEETDWGGDAAQWASFS